MLFLLLLTTSLTTAFNLTYPTHNSTVVVYYQGSFSFLWTSNPTTDPKEINIGIQANTRNGNPQALCHNITTSLGRCVVQGEAIDFLNGPAWEAVVHDSRFPGVPGQPGSGHIIFVSKPFALYLYAGSDPTVGTAVVQTGTTGGQPGTATTGVVTGTNTASVMTTALPSSSVSVGGAGMGAGAGDKGRGNCIGAVIAGIVAMVL